MPIYITPSELELAKLEFLYKRCKVTYYCSIHNHFFGIYYKEKNF